MKSKGPMVLFLLFPILLNFTDIYSQNLESEYGDCVSGNCRNGRGVKKYYNDAIYDGRWKNGMFHGFGKLIYDGTYIGEFENGKYNGEGMLITLDKNKYTGQFKNGEYNGLGAFEADPVYGGCRYAGEFKNGEKNGRGFEYLPLTGGRLVGTWKEGRCYDIALYDEKDNFVRKMFEKGEEIPQPSPPADLSYYGVSTGDNVNVRTAPGLKSRRIGSLKKGEALVVLGKTKNRERIKGEEYCWINVLTIRKKRGWVFGRYIHEVTEDNSPENNTYRPLLKSPGFSLERVINSGQTIERCSITIDRENRVCVWDVLFYWPGGIEGYGSVYFYTISSEGKILSYDDYDNGIGDYYITRGTAIFWYRSALRVFDRTKFTKTKPERWRGEYPSKKYKSLLKYDMFRHRKEKKYDMDRSCLSFDPGTLTLFVRLYPLNGKEAVVKKYRFDEKKFRLMEIEER